MATSKQDYNDIIDNIDSLIGEQTQQEQDSVQEYLDNTSDSPGTIMKWLLRKLRDWAYPS